MTIHQFFFYLFFLLSVSVPCTATDLSDLFHYLNRLFRNINPKTLQFRLRQPVERLWLSIGRRTNDNIYDRRAILHRQGFLQRILQFRNLLNKVALVPEHAQHSLIACFYSQC